MNDGYFHESDSEQIEFFKFPHADFFANLERLKSIKFILIKRSNSLNTTMLTPFTTKVLETVKSIPHGRVMTYGRVASLAGNPGGARQVARLLHSMSKKHDLPWHRVVNAKGKISLRPSQGYELQKALLESEGICFSYNDCINLTLSLWPDTDDHEELYFD